MLLGLEVMWSPLRLDFSCSVLRRQTYLKIYAV